MICALMGGKLAPSSEQTTHLVKKVKKSKKNEPKNLRVVGLDHSYRLVLKSINNVRIFSCKSNLTLHFAFKRTFYLNFR